MRVLAVLCSPFRGGNSDTLADTFLRTLRSAEVERLLLSDLKISPCRSCRFCDGNGECVVKDDVPGIYERLLKADIVVVSAPCHMGGFPAKAQALFERAQFLWARKYLLKKPINRVRPCRLFALLTGGQRSSAFRRGMVETLRIWGRTLDMVLESVIDAGGLHNHGDAARDFSLLHRVKLLAASLIPPHFTHL